MISDGRRDVTIVGAGIMGCFTAIYAARAGATVTLIDSSYVGNPETASFGITRSVRNDYLGMDYSILAAESRRLWSELQAESDDPLIVYSGMLNLVKQAITPDVEKSWAYKSFETLLRLRTPVEKLDSNAMQQRFPQFSVDEGRLDVDAGFAYVPAVTALIEKALQHANVDLREQSKVTSVVSFDEYVVTTTSDHDEIVSRSLVITAGHGSNEVLSVLDGNALQCPTWRDRPKQNKYFVPRPEVEKLFTPDVFPVFAYLDLGIYGHPWYPGKTKGVKVAYYRPVDAPVVESGVDTVEKFVAECIPDLADADVFDITETDLCDYDNVIDDEFIVGRVPGFDNVYIGTGWRGTGYKFGPWVGNVLSQLSVYGGTFYDINRFDPARFTQEGAFG